MLRKKFYCLQEIPPSDPVDQGDEGDWETVGEPAERSHSPAPAMTEIEPQALVAEGRTELGTTPTAEEPVAIKPKKRCLLKPDLSTSPAYLAPRP
jgi:hypothetical protein